MFFICDENHWFKAWVGYINRLHQNDLQWHYSMDSICLFTKSKGGLLMNAMHNINKWDLLLLFWRYIYSLLDWYLLTNSLYKSSEHSHVKTNMVHTLHQIKAMDCQPLESIKDLLTKEECKKYANNPYIKKTWYKLATNVFVAFIFWITILFNHYFILFFIDKVHALPILLHLYWC